MRPVITEALCTTTIQAIDTKGIIFECIISGLSHFYNGNITLFDSKTMHNSMYGSSFNSDLIQDSKDMRRSEGKYKFNSSDFLVVFCKLAECCCEEAGEKAGLVVLFQNMPPLSTAGVKQKRSCKTASHMEAVGY